MIGLPRTLVIDEKEYRINTDYKIALLIFEAFNDPELGEYEKGMVLLRCLYTDFNKIPLNDYQESIEKAIWFLDGGRNYENYNKTKKIMDWEQDENIIFPALNKVAGFEIREKNIHWWTFLGFFNELGEGLLTTVINIRNKKNKGKKLEKVEEEFYRNNKELINIKQRYTVEEQAEIDLLNKLLK